MERGNASQADPGRVRIALGELELLVPQADVHSVEPIAEIDETAATGASVGAVQLAARQWPIYALSAALSPRRTVPDEARVCVLLGDAGFWFGLVCLEIGAVGVSRIASTPLPVCMRKAPSPIDALALPPINALALPPIDALALLDERVMCITSAARLGEYLHRVHGVSEIVEQGTVAL